MESSARHLFQRVGLRLYGGDAIDGLQLVQECLLKHASRNVNTQYGGIGCNLALKVPLYTTPQVLLK